MLKVHKLTKNELLQDIWRKYQQAHGRVPAGTRPVIDWALSEGMIDLPRIDPKEVLASQLSDALRIQTAVDKQGRIYRVNHPVRTKQGEQTEFQWASMQFASRNHMEKSFAQRRNGIISDCYHLRTDVDAYNAQNPGEPPIQLELNFSEDVAERIVLREVEPAAV